jgi:hypothetical protein
LIWSNIEHLTLDMEENQKGQNMTRYNGVNTWNRYLQISLCTTA